MYRVIQLFLALIFTYCVFLSTIYAKNLNIQEDKNDEFLEFHLPKDLNYLHLSNEQNIKIQTLLIWYQARINDFNNKKSSHIEDIKQIFLDKTFDLERFTEFQRLYHLEKIKIQSEFLNKIHSILDLKQRKKFLKYMQEWNIE